MGPCCRVPTRVVGLIAQNAFKIGTEFGFHREPNFSASVVIYQELKFFAKTAIEIINCVTFFAYRRFVHCDGVYRPAENFRVRGDVFLKRKKREGRK